MTGDRFRMLLDLCMVSDPWPLDALADAILKDWLDAESRERGFDNWVEAFHRFKP